MRRFLTVTLVAIFVSAGFLSAGSVFGLDEGMTPLAKGAQVPDVQVKSIDGEPVDLKEKLAGKPAVIIFYRGGWCPYCNVHLGKLQEVTPELRKLGYQMIGISPDRPSRLKDTLASRKIDYTLLSDNTAAAIKKFGLAFTIPDEVVKKYKEDYNIDIEADSGMKHHILPIPAAYVVDAKGMVRYVYSNENYKVRIAPEELLAEAKKAVS